MSYLFGSILTVDNGDLIMMGGLSLLVIATVSLNYRGILAMTYDEDFARTRGVPVTLLHVVLVMLVSLGVVLVIRVVGLILVIALLTIPPSRIDSSN